MTDRPTDQARPFDLPTAQDAAWRACQRLEQRLEAFAEFLDADDDPAFEDIEALVDAISEARFAWGTRIAERDGLAREEESNA